jgi:hypothetical protein
MHKFQYKFTSILILFNMYKFAHPINKYTHYWLLKDFIWKEKKGYLAARGRVENWERILNWRRRRRRRRHSLWATNSKFVIASICYYYC